LAGASRCPASTIEAQLRHAPAIAKPTFGQLLGVGVALLAWLLDRATRG